MDMDADDYLNTIHGSCNVVTSSAYQLEDLASAFLRMGNKTTCLELETISRNLHEASKRTHSAVGKEMHRQMVQAEQSSFLILEATLTSITQHD